MIFVTVGTTPFPFLRMRNIVSRFAENKKNNEEIVFQHGATPAIVHASVKNFYFLPYFRMKTYMSKARIIISHGGPATIYQAILAGKAPYVLPRKKAFVEHVDDHQVFFGIYGKKVSYPGDYSF